MADHTPRHHRAARPVWARWQIGAAIFLLVTAVAMFTTQALAPPLLGKAVDFGVIAPTLLGVAIYVIFGINLPRLIGKESDDD